MKKIFESIFIFIFVYSMWMILVWCAYSFALAENNISKWPLSYRTDASFFMFFYGGIVSSVCAFIYYNKKK